MEKYAGYSPTSPVVVVQCKGTRSAYGKQKWGAEKGIKHLVIDREYNPVRLQHESERIMYGRNTSELGVQMAGLTRI